MDLKMKSLIEPVATRRAIFYASWLAAILGPGLALEYITLIFVKLLLLSSYSGMSLRMDTFSAVENLKRAQQCQWVSGRHF
jgi:hypothetical protein